MFHFVWVTVQMLAAPVADVRVAGCLDECVAGYLDECFAGCVGVRVAVVVCATVCT